MKRYFFNTWLWGALIWGVLLPGWVCADGLLVRDIAVSAAQIEPGHVLKVTVRWYRPGLQVRMAGWGQKVTLSVFAGEPLSGSGYLAVPLGTAPRTEEIAVVAQDAQGTQTQKIRVEVLPPAKRRMEILRIKNYSELRFEPESRLMAALRARSALQGDSPVGQFLPPLPGGKSNNNFLVKRVYRPSNLTSVHRGVDIDAPGGTAICAPADGVVLLARKFKAHGNTTLLDHGQGVVTTFLHQSRILVKPGQHVKAGETIGKVGSTGASTGPHLHFQVNVHNLVVDPDDFLQTPTGAPVVLYSAEAKQP